MYVGLQYLLVPWVVLLLSLFVTSHIPLSNRIRSAINHFTAGVILAALAVELLPEVLGNHQPINMSIGFLSGTAVMLFLKWFSGRSKEPLKQHRWPWGFIVPVMIDLFVDGWLIVLALQISLNAALILSLALSLEMLSLGASIWMMLRKIQSCVPCCLTMSFIISLALVAGGMVGYWTFGWLSSAAFVICLSFGMAALLYLAAEELLVEAHSDVEDGPFLTSFLFLGVWFILLFKELI